MTVVFPSILAPPDAVAMEDTFTVDPPQSVRLVIVLLLLVSVKLPPSTHVLAPRTPSIVSVPEPCFLKKPVVPERFPEKVVLAEELEVRVPDVMVMFPEPEIEPRDSV